MLVSGSAKIYMLLAGRALGVGGERGGGGVWERGEGECKLVQIPTVTRF